MRPRHGIPVTHISFRDRPYSVSGWPASLAHGQAAPLASRQCAPVATLRSTVGARGQQRSQARVYRWATGRGRVGVEWGAPGSADTDRISMQRAASVAKLGGAAGVHSSSLPLS